MEKGLLETFIEAQGEVTREPERAGKAKGDPIGFGPVKVKAAASLALLAEPENRVAAGLGISEEVLRKWHHEPAFKQRMREILDEFRIFLVDYIRNLPGKANGNDSKEVLGPGAARAVAGAVKQFLPKADGRWMARATHCVYELYEAQRTGPKISKWVLKRHVNDSEGEDALLFAVSEKIPGENEPLETTFFLLRQRMYAEADNLLDQPELNEEKRSTLKEMLHELKRTERRANGV